MSWLISFEFFGTQHFFVICWVVYSEMIFKVACCKYQKTWYARKQNWYRLIRLVYTIHFVPLVLGYIKHVRKMVLCCLFTALYCRVSIDDFEYVSKCCQFRFMDWQLAAAYSLFIIFAKSIDYTHICSTILSNIS